MKIYKYNTIQILINELEQKLQKSKKQYDNIDNIKQYLSDVTMNEEFFARGKVIQEIIDLELFIHNLKM